MVSGIALSFGEILTILGLVFAVISTVGGVWWKLNNKLNTMEKEANERSVANTNALNEYKLQVAKEYVPNANLIHMEAKLTAGLATLTDRIDRLLSRE